MMKVLTGGSVSEGEKFAKEGAGARHRMSKAKRHLQLRASRFFHERIPRLPARNRFCLNFVRLGVSSWKITLTAPQQCV
jgi:hypothetical protein